MRRYTAVLINTSGVPQAGQTVKISPSGTTSATALFDDSGAAIANPVTTDSSGQYSFVVRSGVYDFYDANGVMIKHAEQIYDISNPNEWLGQLIPNLQIQNLTAVSATLSNLLVTNGTSGILQTDTASNILTIGNSTTNLVIRGGAITIGSSSPITIGDASSQLAFFGGLFQSKPTITGSKGGNAALASLLTALGSGVNGLGLLIDSTT